VRVEAYLLDFHGDLYGARVELTLEARLRPEEHYADVEALKVQIGEDVRQTRAHFGLDAGAR
jgi:riboflavin kinase/FMN adenylyltransferase